MITGLCSHVNSFTIAIILNVNFQGSDHSKNFMTNDKIGYISENRYDIRTVVRDSEGTRGDLLRLSIDFTHVLCCEWQLNNEDMKSLG